MPNGQRERLHALAAEIARLPLDVLLAHGGGVEAKQATSTIPIVVVASPDPVGLGVASAPGRERHGAIGPTRRPCRQTACPYSEKQSLRHRVSLSSIRHRPRTRLK